MLKRNVFRLILMLLLSLLGLSLIGYTQQQQTVTVAFLNLPNTFSAMQTFQQGFSLPSAGGGAITVVPPIGNVSRYTLVLPASGGQAGYYICVGSTTGTLTALAHCPASGSGSPLVSTSPFTLSYGSVAVSTISTLPILITNTGNATLVFSASAFTFTGDMDFTVSANTASTCMNSGMLLGGQTCTLSLDFEPSTTGARSATLSIADNATGSPQTVSLSGTGI